tara:strand:- start:196 stop:474 length:279 start_codon:yes stop_codon:yes gene_type:complete
MKKVISLDTKSFSNRIHSDDGNHLLKKENDTYFFGYDNGKDLRMWKLQLPKNFDEKKLFVFFQQLTGSDRGIWDYFNWLKKQKIKLTEHTWW